MRKIIEHKVNPVNDRLEIVVLDEPGAGGASHEYEIGIANKSGIVHSTTRINFQNGPIGEAQDGIDGVNGVTHEALLAILADRLRSFQHGPYASPDNEMALNCIEQAQFALRRRTLNRMARGVEGTHQV